MFGFEPSRLNPNPVYLYLFLLIILLFVSCIYCNAEKVQRMLITQSMTTPEANTQSCRTHRRSAVSL
jgi:hypothetical protein